MKILFIAIIVAFVSGCTAVARKGPPDSGPIDAGADAGPGPNDGGAPSSSWTPPWSTAPGVPQVSHAIQSVGPGQVAYVAGVLRQPADLSGFAVEGLRLSDSPPPTQPPSTSPVLPSDFSQAQNLTVYDSSWSSVKTLIPSEWQAGMYALRISNASGNSKAVLLNRPTLHFWIGGPAHQAYPGELITLYGVNLANTVATPQAWLVSAADPSQSYVLTLSQGSTNDSYHVSYQLPQGLASGNYLVYAHNGFGSMYGFSDAIPVTVGTRAAPPAFTIDVTDASALQNVCNQLATTDRVYVNDCKKPIRIAMPVATGSATSQSYDSSVSIQIALAGAALQGGGTVSIPAGSYVVNNPLALPDNTTLTGALYDPSNGGVPSTELIFPAPAASDTPGQCPLKVGTGLDVDPNSHPSSGGQYPQWIKVPTLNRDCAAIAGTNSVTIQNLKVSVTQWNQVIVSPNTPIMQAPGAAVKFHPEDLGVRSHDLHLANLVVLHAVHNMASPFGPNDWDALKVFGDGARLTNVNVQTSASVPFLWVYAHHYVIKGSHFSSNASYIWGDSISSSVFENNEISGENPVGSEIDGGGFVEPVGGDCMLPQGKAEKLFFFGNRFSNCHANSGEALSFDTPYVATWAGTAQFAVGANGLPTFTPDKKYTKSYPGPNGTTTVVGPFDDQINDYKHGTVTRVPLDLSENYGLLVTYGPGVGQFHSIASNDPSSAQLAEPWVLPPDPTLSQFAVGPLKRQVVVANNHFENVVVAVQLYGTSVGFIIDGNTTVNSGGMYCQGENLWVVKNSPRPTQRNRFIGCYFNLFQNNSLQGLINLDTTPYYSWSHRLGCALGDCPYHLPYWSDTSADGVNGIIGVLSSQEGQDAMSNPELPHMMGEAVLGNVIRNNSASAGQQVTFGAMYISRPSTAAVAHLIPAIDPSSPQGSGIGRDLIIEGNLITPASGGSCSQAAHGIDIFPNFRDTLIRSVNQLNSCSVLDRGVNTRFPVE